MELAELMRDIELFRGLTDDELDAIAAICTSKKLAQGEILVRESERGEDFYIIAQGAVEVQVEAQAVSPRSIVRLGVGQIIGEMALVDAGPRSATVRAVQADTRVQAIHNRDFKALCEQNEHIGYIVMRNIAADLSFKLRHKNLERGNQS